MHSVEKNIIIVSLLFSVKPSKTISFHQERHDDLHSHFSSYLKDIWKDSSGRNRERHVKRKILVVKPEKLREVVTGSLRK